MAGGSKLAPIRISPIKLATFGGTWPGPRGKPQKDIWNLCLISYSFDFQLGGVYMRFNHITSPSWAVVRCTSELGTICAVTGIPRWHKDERT